MGKLEHVVESADAAPTPDALKAFRQRKQVMESTLRAWNEIRTKDLPRLNSLLRQAKLRVISVE
ncbi:MAG: hypothetical protein P8Z30_03505 [Acidobacteriota bacterium]